MNLRYHYKDMRGGGPFGQLRLMTLDSKADRADGIPSPAVA
jgi:hypothetical protein